MNTLSTRNRVRNGWTGAGTLAGIAGLACAVLMGGCGAFDSPPAWSMIHGAAPVSASPRPAVIVETPAEAADLLAVAPGAAVAADHSASMSFENPATDSPATMNMSRVTFAEEGADFDPCVSRDGTKLVFASTQHRNTSDIYIKRTDSRVVTQLTNDPGQDAMPVLSPDGTKIAFASDRAGNWDVYVMPVTGGKAVQISSDGADEVHPSWSPDGKQLVFSRMGQASGRWEMWVADVQNPAVANFIGYGLFPQWCPVAGSGEGGADRILFQLGRERGRRAFGLWTVDITPGGATNATEIASSPQTALINPTWSPDGKWIVYAEVPLAAGMTTNASAQRPAWATLWMLSVEGEGKVRLTGGPGIALSPVWGANNKLFFVCNRGGAENIWSLDLSPAIVAAQATIGGGKNAVTTAGVAGHDAAHKSEAVATIPEGEAKLSQDH